MILRFTILLLMIFVVIAMMHTHKKLYIEKKQQSHKATAVFL